MSLKMKLSREGPQLFLVLFLIDFQFDLPLLRRSCRFFTAVADDNSDQGYRLPTFQQFLVIASRSVRPSQLYEVHVTLLRLRFDTGLILVRAGLSQDGAEYTSASVEFSAVGTRAIQLQVPASITAGSHKLTVEALVSSTIYNVISSVATVPGQTVASATNVVYRPIFFNETYLVFTSKSVSIFVVTNRPEYVTPDAASFYVVAVTPDLRPAAGSMTIYIEDSKGNQVRRWIQKQFNFGVYSGTFDIDYPVNVGQWAIVIVAFGHTYRHEFGVRFWWQRSVELNITTPLHMYDTEWGVMGLLYGEHVSGQPGYGNGSVVVKLMDRNGTVHPGEICKHLGYMYSTQSFVVSMSEIRSLWGDPSGKDLYFLGSLTDYYYLETLTGTSITHVHKDGVRLRVLGRTVRSFKPETPFDIQVAVERMDGSMYEGTFNRQLIVTVSSDGGGSADDDIIEDKQIIPDDNILQYTVEPGQDSYRIYIRVTHVDSGQTVDITCYRYYSSHGRYLSVSTSTAEPETESYMVFTVKTNFHVTELTYMISSGGSILFTSTLIMTSQQKTFAVALSRQMAPAAHIIIYCIVQGEVIVDSLSFYIRDSQLKQSKISLNFGKDFKRDSIELIANGPPGSYVFTTAVDYEFIIRGALPFITEQKVIHELLTYDVIGQGPHEQTWWNYNEAWEESVFFPAYTTGLDTNSSFIASGLVIMSDTNLTIRQDYSPCNHSLGLGICPSTYTCYELSRQCDDVPDCLDGFDELLCPLKDSQRYKRRPNELSTLFWNSRFQDDWTAFWKTHYLKQVGQAEIHIEQEELMDPLVWGAFFMHPDTGLSICEEWIQHDTTRDFFVTIENPDVIRRGEQLGLRLDVYNYWDQDLEVLILLHGDDDYRFVTVEDFGYVSSYKPRLLAGDVQIMVSVPGGQQCLYIMMPIVAVIESGDIVVRISAYSRLRNDYNEVPITVTYDGVVGRIRHTPYLIDLVNTGSLVIPDLKIPVSERFVDPEHRDLLYIPYSNRANLYVYGDVVSPGLFVDYLTTKDTSHSYHDTAEGYLFEFAVNLQTLNYLQTLNQLDQEKVKTTLIYMQTTRQYSFMDDDGGYRQFRRSSHRSLRVTSLVLKSLHAALVSQWAEDLYVPVNILNSVGRWLAAQQDTETGMFRETLDHPYDRSFTSAKQRVDVARRKACNYLSSKISNLTDPFQIAITAYALELGEHKARGAAYNLLKNIARRSEFLYWSAEAIPPNPTQRINNVDFQYERQFHPNVENAVMATSYALLLYLAHNEYIAATPIMKWISSQRNRLMGWSSTMDTLLALESLTEFSYRQTNRDFYNIRLTFECSSNSTWKESIQINSSNLAQLYTFPIEPAFGQLKTRVEGTGYAMIAMDTYYHLEKPYQVEREGPEFKSFYIDTDFQRFWGRNGSHMEMGVCFKWLRTDLAPVSGMSNIIIEIPTGYLVSRDTIEWMYSAGFPALKRVQFYDQKLIIFFEYVGPNRTCVSFVADRWHPVANMSIAHLLMIQEYHETGLQLISAYNTFTLFHHHICQVCGSYQCPYCDYYNTGIPLAVLSATCLALNFLTAFLVLFQYSRRYSPHSSQQYM